MMAVKKNKKASIVTTEGPYGIGEKPTFHELKAPQKLDPDRVREAIRYTKLKRTPKRRISESYMLETHLGGVLERVDHFDSRIAMSDGFESRWISPRGRVGRSVFDLQPNEQPVGDAWLSPESIFNEGQPWTRIINTSQVPWRSVCHLEISYESGRTAQGTGWLSASDTVITAGHNVFSAEGDGWATSIIVVPGRDASLAPFNPTYARKVDALPGWINNKDSKFDVGVIKTADTSIGIRTGWFGYAVFTDSDLRNSPLIHSAGYPAETRPSGTQWFDAGRVTNFSTSFVEYRLDTERGHSGGPIFFTNDAGQRWVIATHVYGRRNANLGCRITDPIFDAIQTWIDSD